MIIYQLLFGGESPFAGKWIGTGETPETNELIRQGLWLYAPNSLIQLVERTIPLGIVHPEVQRCFLRCFNDGYKNSDLRPTAGDWVKALRLAVNELTICGKVDSHYYSQTYGKCYWCDRSTKLGVDIFPGFARPKQQSAFSVSALEPEAFAADKIIENVAIGGQIHTTQSNIPQLAASTPHIQPATTQPSTTPTTTSSFTIMEVFLLLGWLGYGCFLLIAASVPGSAWFVEWFVLPFGIFMLLFYLVFVLISQLNRHSTK